MNLVVMRLAARAIVGGWRGKLLLILPLLLFAIAGLTRWQAGADPATTANMINYLALGLGTPLTCLLIGTGAIGSEIADGSIVYLLSKNVPRRVIAISKLLVAYSAAFLFAVVPTGIATLIAGDKDGQLASAMIVASTLAVLGYVTLFFLLAIVARNAVVIGLMYALVWETTLGTAVPGVRNLSIRQWSLAWAEKILSGNATLWDVQSDVKPLAGAILLAVTVIGAAALSVRALNRLQPRPTE